MDERPGAQDNFKVPLDLDVRPKALPEALHSALGTPAQLDAEPSAYSSRWRAWQPSPGYIWGAPPWYQTGCYGNTLAPVAALTMPVGPPATSPNFTIGSLAGDGAQALLRSPDSYSTDLGSPYGGLAKPGALSVQYGLEPLPCGAPGFLGF
jgi:hypothetical protein